MRAWHLGAVICGTKTCYLGATYYGADLQGLFLQKVTKITHMWNSFAKRAKLQKLRPVAPQPGGQGRPPRCRAVWGAGRPAAGRPVPRDLRAIFSAKIFAQKPRPPRCRAAGVYSCKFPNWKYIFVKNENKKYKNRLGILLQSRIRIDISAFQAMSRILGLSGLKYAVARWNYMSCIRTY